MAACPLCANPLEHAAQTFFCASCRSSLQPRATLAATLGVGRDTDEFACAPDRFAHPIGACAACDRGELQPARLLGEAIAACSACAAIWLNRDQLARMRARVEREDAKRPVRPVQTDAERDASVHRIAFDDVWTNAGAYPGALLVGALAHVLGLSFLVWGTVEMWFHELGHAVVAWLSGFVAVPLPFFTILPRETRSGSVIAIVLAMIAAIAYESWKRRYRGLVVFAALLGVTQLFLTLVLDAPQARQWGIFAGQAGAIVLPTLVMMLFYQHVGWRWDFWRYPVLVIASVGLVHALFIWIAVARGTGEMPHGSAIGDDSQGDMERLIAQYHWTKTSLASTYFAIALACLAALAVTYAVFLKRALAKRA